MPFESRVFLLDEPRFYKRIIEDSYRQRKLERLAEQLNTIAIALGGDFDMFYQSQISNCVDLASLTRKKLNQNGRLSSTIGDMIIVDRSYDPFAPLLHELTYQAMTYDVLRADGDIVKIENRELLLDETEDKSWASLRHMHMADVMKKLANEYEDLMAKQKGLNKTDGTTKSLAELMRRLPHFQRQILELERHISISEELDKNYDTWIDDLCDVEQDLACDSIEKPIKAIIPWILNKTLSDEMKMRLILLLCHNKKGIEEEKLVQLLKNSGIKEDQWKVVKNMRYFNATVVENDLPVIMKMPKRKQNEKDLKFTDSRYVSRITDLIHYNHANELDDRIFTKIPSVKPKISSIKSGTQKRKTIVFILGGVAPSEMRAAFELSNNTFKPSASWFSSKNNCTFTSDVYIGSSHIAMPHTQLKMFSDI